MSEVTRVLTAIEQGDAKASEALLPLPLDRTTWLARRAELERLRGALEVPNEKR